jgi:MarR family transcriptional regulator, 2-MHQ and catechol-resistance regulon repressor
MPSRLQQEIKKRDPFDSIEQEAILNLLRTSDQVHNRLGRLFRQFDLTPSKYNVLRILRGEGKPIPVLEVASRLIQVVPAITGLIDRLEAQGLVQRKKCEEDRRVVYVAITKRGLELLTRIEQPLTALQQDLMRIHSKADLTELIRLLEKTREGFAKAEIEKT